MIQVRCEGCQATFELDERRIPKSGMRVRCPKCASSFHVTPDGQTSALQPPGVKPPPAAVAKPAAPRDADLPVPASPKVSPPAMTAPGVVDLPAPAAPRMADLPARAVPRAGSLPIPAAPPPLADLPVAAAPRGSAPLASPSMDLDLPVPAAPRVADLPVAATPRPVARPGMSPGAPTKMGTGAPVLASRALAATIPADVFGDDLPSPSRPRAAPPSPAPVAPSDPMDFGFGDIDLPSALSLDLPSPARSIADLPTPVRPSADLPSPVRVADLPNPLRSTAYANPPPPPAGLDLHNLDDFPMTGGALLAPAGVTTDDLDDPFAAGRSADLPATRKDPAADLPSPVSSGGDLPALRGTDLPNVVAPEVVPAKKLGRVTLERRAVPVQGEAALPAPIVAAGLPSVSGGAALPVTAKNVGLPMAASNVGLPSAPIGLPAVAPAQGGFGDLDLGMRAPSVPPAAAAPTAALRDFDGLPMRPPSGAPPASGAVDDFDLGAPAAPSLPAPSLGLPTPGIDLPLPPPPLVPSGMGAQPTSGLRAVSPAVTASQPQRATGAGGTDFGEISLGGDDDEVAPAAPARPPFAPSSATAADDAEFDQIPLEDAPQKSPKAQQSADHGIETAIPPRELAGEKAEKEAAKAEKVRARAARRQEGAAKPTSRVPLYVALGLLGVVIVGGAALSLTPLGAFGTTWLDDHLHGAARRSAAQRAIETVRTAIDHDTYAGIRRALRALDVQIQRTPSQSELFAYGAYANYVMLARFGNDSAASSRARTLFDRFPTLPPGTPYMPAARLARDLVQGRLDGVRRASATDPLTRDLRIAALLDGDDPAAALDAARANFERAHTTRAHFLYARALYIADDRGGAIHEAEAILQTEAQHAGARLLLARLLSDRAETRDRAVTLAGEVEAMGNAAAVDERSEASVMTGEIELGRDHVTQARQAFERALETDPRSPQALNGVATIMYRESNFTEALARFQAAHSADTSDLDANIGIAMASIALNQAADARSTLEPLVPTHPNEPRLHFWLAKALLAVNEQTPAEREFREAIRLDNANLEAYTTLASMLFASHRPEAAEAVLQEARAHVSDQASIHRALGEGRAARGDLAGAVGELEQAIAARPDDIRSHFLFAQTLRQLQRFDDAARQLAEVARIDAEYPGLLVERGMLAEVRGDAVGALTTFRAALAHDQGNPQLIVRVVSALIANGQYAEAESQARQLLAEHGTIAEAHYVRGRAQLGLGNAEQAVQEFNRAIDLDATRADYRAYAAEANLALSQFGAALEQASRAIALDGNYARGYWVRGEVRVRSGAAVQGLVDVQQALRIDPRFAPALATLADADEALGHSPEAIIVYRQAISLEPNRGEWRSRLGRLLADAGRTGDAVTELNRAVSLGDPMNPPPAWLAAAHRQLGDLLAEGDRAAARRHFQRFLELTPPQASGYAEVRRALADLGGP